MKTNLSILLALLLALCNLKVDAQTPSVTISAVGGGSDFIMCSNYTCTVTVACNPGDHFAVGILPASPNVMQVSSSSAIITNGIGIYTTYTFFNVTANGPYNFTFTMDKCSMIPSDYALNHQPINPGVDIHVLLYDFNTTAAYAGSWDLNGNTATGNPETYSYVVHFPFMVLATISNPSQNDGDVFTRTIAYRNDGTTTDGDFTGYFSFTDNFNAACAAISFTNLKVYTGEVGAPVQVLYNGAFIPFTQNGGFVVNSDHGTINEFLVFEETISINGCLDICNPDIICDGSCPPNIACTSVSTIDFTWGCTAAEICGTYDLETCSQITRNTNHTPHVEYSRVLPVGVANYGDAVWESSCPGAITDWHFTVTNTGNANAYNVLMPIRNGMGTGYPYYVLLINQNGHTVHATGPGTYTITPTVLTGTPTLTNCYSTYNTGNNILEQADILIDKIEVNQVYDIYFSTLRCCPDDDDAQFSLFDYQGICFNKWFIRPTAENECAAPASVTPVANPYFPDQGAPGSISVNYENGVDLDLRQELLPNVSDLTGVTDGGLACNLDASQTGRFSVHNMTFDKLNRSVASIFSGPAFSGFTDEDDILINGQIKVHFDLQPGLKLFVDGTANYEVDMTHNVGGTIYTWLPQAQPAFADCPPPHTHPGDYTYDVIFDFSQACAGATPIPLMPGNTNCNSLKNFKDFITNSYINFSMTGCCCDRDGDNIYTVSTYINANPAACGNCWMPLSQKGNKVHVHCPGCTTPGISVDGFHLIRSDLPGTNSYGLEDANDNGRADVSAGATHQIDNGYLINHTGVKRNYSIAGDYIIGTLDASFLGGNNQLNNGTQPAGCSYSSWKGCTGQTLDFLYLEQQIPFSDRNATTGALEFDLKVQSCTLTISRAGGACTLPGGSVIIYVPLTAIDIPQNHSAGDVEFFYDFSLANLFQWTGLLPLCYEFEPGDQFHIETLFKVCNNYNNNSNTVMGEDDESSSDPNFCRHESEVQNYMYLTGTAKSYKDYVAQIIPWAGDVWTSCVSCDYSNCTDVNTYLDPSYIYKCQTNGSFHYFLDVQTINSTAVGDAVLSGIAKCKKFIRSFSEIKTGGNMINAFPFEYRPVKPIISYNLNIPNLISDQYSITDGHATTFLHSYNSGCADYTSSITRLYATATHPNSCSGTNYNTFNINPPGLIYNFNYQEYTDDAAFNSCLTACPPLNRDMATSFTGLVTGDEYLKQELFLELTPPCSTSEIVTPFGVNIVSQVYDNLSCAGGSHPEDDLTLLGACPLELHSSAPIITMTPTTIITASTNGDVCWIERIENHMPPPNGCDLPSPAEHVFIYLPPPTADFLFTGVTGCAANLTYGNCSTLGCIYDLGTLNPGTSCDVTICGNQLMCQGTPNALVNFQWGWNCNPVSTVADVQNACGLHNETFSFTEAPGTLNTSLEIDGSATGPFTYSNCTPSTFVVTVTTPNPGTFYGIYFNINTGSPHLMLSPNYSIQYNGGGPINGTLVGTTLNLASYDNGLFDDVTGGPGLCCGEEIQITFTFFPDCDYNGTITPIINVSGIEYCGTVVNQQLFENWSFGGINACPFCVDITQDYTTVCSGDPVTLIANPTGGQLPYTYEWDDPAHSSTANIIVNPLVPTTYTCIVTDNTMASETLYVFVNVINSSPPECCLPANFSVSDFDFSNKNVATVISDYPTSIISNSISTNSIILINGTFTVDDNFTFSSCTNVLLGPDAVIDVLPGVILSINDSWLFAGCNDLWDRINVQGGARLIGVGSHFADAKTAIFSTNVPDYILLTANTFDRNNYSVHLKSGDFSSVHIYSNNFECTAPILTLNHNTVAQINLESADHVTIGDPAYLPNQITDADFGIRALNSNLEVVNNNFSLTSGFVTTTKPTAIYAALKGLSTSCHYLRVNPSGNGHTLNTFYNWRKGIETLSMEEVTIKNNAFDRCDNSVSMTKAVHTETTDNTISNFTRGIGLYDGVGVFGHNNGCYVNNLISSNHFNPNLSYPPFRYGLIAIDVQNKVTNINNTVVSGNDILHTNIGINALQSYLIKINSFNTYNAQIPAADLALYNAHYGILVQNCFGADVSNNQCQWTGGSITLGNGVGLLPLMKGIFLKDCMKNTIKENVVLNMAAGINTFGICTNSNLYCNGMYGCYHGGFLDDQSLNTSMTDQGIAVFNPFYDPDLSISWKNHWAGNVNTKVDGINWGALFSWEYFVSPYDPDYAPELVSPLYIARPCSLEDVCNSQAPFMDDNKRKAAFGAAVGDSSETDVDSLEYAYNDKEAFYKQAKDDQNILSLGLPDDAAFQAKFEELSQSNIGKFEEAKEHLVNEENLLALQKLQTMLDPTIIDQNKVTMGYLIAIDYDPYLDSDSDTISVVNYIAHQHPFYGGEGVYMARGMLHENIIDLLPPLRRGKGHPFNNSTVSIQDRYYPNPTSNEVTFVSSRIFNQGERLELFNSFGALRKIINLPDKENQVTFNLEDLQQGVYYSRVVSNYGERKIEKLVVIK